MAKRDKTDPELSSVLETLSEPGRAAVAALWIERAARTALPKILTREGRAEDAERLRTIPSLESARALQGALRAVETLQPTTRRAPAGGKNGASKAPLALALLAEHIRALREGAPDLDALLRTSLELIELASMAGPDRGRELARQRTDARRVRSSTFAMA